MNAFRPHRRPAAALLVSVLGSCSSGAPSEHEPKSKVSARESTSSLESAAAPASAPLDLRVQWRKALADWPARWQAVEDLPSSSGHGAAVEQARVALARVKAASRDKASDEVVLSALGDLAISAETARAQLSPPQRTERSAASTRPAAGEARSVPSARAAFIDPPDPNAVPSPTSTGRSGLDPALVTGGAGSSAPYGNVARLALRHLSIYARYGSLDVRRAATGELERVAKALPGWSELFRTVAEVRPFEQDPSIAARLGALRGRDEASPGSPQSGVAQLPAGNP